MSQTKHYACSIQTQFSVGAAVTNIRRPATVTEKQLNTNQWNASCDNFAYGISLEHTLDIATKKTIISIPSP